MTTTHRPKLSPQFLAMVQERSRRNLNRMIEQDEAEARRDAQRVAARRAQFRIVKGAA